MISEIIKMPGFMPTDSELKSGIIPSIYAASVSDTSVGDNSGSAPKLH